MNGTRLLLDTNIVLYLLSGDKTLADFLSGKEIYLSVITEMEILSFKALEKKDEKSIHEFLSDCKIVSLNEKIKEKAIQIRKISGNKLPDCIIGATANHLDIPLISADKDFKKMKDISLIYYKK